jgi:O-antigen ligase
VTGAASTLWPPGGRAPSSPATASPAAVTAAALAAALLAAALAVLLGPKALALAVAAAVAVLLVRVPPLLLALFVYVPYFKSEPSVAALPMDPTLALGALLLGVVVHRLAQGRFRRPSAAFVIPTLVIGVALVIGLAWTPDPSYGMEKVVKFWSVTVLALAAPFFLFETRRDLLVFLGSVAGIAALVAAITPFAPAQKLEGITTDFDTHGRYSFGGQIFPARLITTGVLILLFVPTFTRWRLRWLCIPVAIAMLVISLGLGSRGPIVSFVVALALVLALSAIRNPRYLAVIVAIACMGIAIFPFISLPETARDRLTKTASNPTQVLHDDLRFEFYRQAIDLSGRYPLTGIGTGGFAVYSSVLAKQDILYPHNIFLELSSELGLIVPLFLVFTLGAALALLLKRASLCAERRSRQLVCVLIGLLMLNLFGTQFSGDINDNRILWLFLAVGWLVARYGLLDSPPRTAGQNATPDG